LTLWQDRGHTGAGVKNEPNTLAVESYDRSVEQG